MLNQPFFQVTLPLMVTFVATIWLAQWSQNKRLDSIERRIDDIVRRLERIEAKLEDFAHRITTLEAGKWR